MMYRTGENLPGSSEESTAAVSTVIVGARGRREVLESMFEDEDLRDGMCASCEEGEGKGGKRRSQDIEKFKALGVREVQGRG